MNLHENIDRIKQVMGINETFDAGVEPTLKDTYEEGGAKVYSYVIPSKKSEEEYIIKLKFYKEFKDPKIKDTYKDVMVIDFNLGAGSYYNTNLNEVFYIFASINKLIEKYKKKFQYLMGYSNKDRLSLYKKALSRASYLELVDEGSHHIIYKNKDYSRWF